MEKLTLLAGSAGWSLFVTVAVQVDGSLGETAEVQETAIFVTCAALCVAYTGTGPAELASRAKTKASP